jgi:pyruvate,water dikinase
MLNLDSTAIDIPTLPFSAFLVYRTVLPGVLTAAWQMNRSRRELTRFLETTPAWCRATRREIRNWKDPSSLFMGWQETLKPAIVRACNMLRFATAGLSRPTRRLRQELSALVGNDAAGMLMSNVSSTSGHLASLGPLMGLAQVAKGQLSREAYLELFGHRGPHEMELFIPGPDEDPTWFEKQLAEFNCTPGDVDALLENQRTKQAAAWTSFTAHFPEKAPAIRRRLETIALVTKTREAVRSEVTRMARLVRSFLLQAGSTTGLGDDVFFLSLDELTEVLAGERTSLSRLTVRRNAYRRYTALPVYPAMIVGHFDPFAWAANPNRRSDFYDARQAHVAISSSSVKGFPGAVGCVEGFVRHIDREEDGYQIQPGEILVTTTTNVGWTPLFPRLAAIVTDVGAPLSHAAIVARELGIPAVVGCGNATMLLKTGTRVRVDGGRGIVEILSS